MKVSVLSLGLLPLTFGYAIFRYRLMDVDLIFKRGMAYTLAAAAIVAAYFAAWRRSRSSYTRVPSSGTYGLIVAVVVTALLFDPVRKWIQEKLDHFFYRTGYDYRRTLIEFGRELSSETDLDKMLASLVDRLARTCWWIASRSSSATPTLRALNWRNGSARPRHRPRPVVPCEAASRRCGRAYLLRNYAPIAA